ncbi:DUF6440 family protein [Lacticaseibacillus zhaodongensis]|uniref:DUF6440 family protein n=1 Tax=Lacticaseibacillus zhaodongensis TaxID=2668065 RepID=UPI0012D2BF5B|nr:DUF6440 family protein [Lacticaseibacillus zhaodongensis]
MSDKENRFVEPDKYPNVGGRRLNVIVDRKTRVQYIVFNGYMGTVNGSGVTVLVDQDGKPLLYSGELPD